MEPTPRGARVRHHVVYAVKSTYGVNAREIQGSLIWSLPTYTFIKTVKFDLKPHLRDTINNQNHFIAWMKFYIQAVSTSQRCL